MKNSFVYHDLKEKSQMSSCSREVAFCIWQHLWAVADVEFKLFMHLRCLPWILLPGALFKSSRLFK